MKKKGKRQNNAEGIHLNMICWQTKLPGQTLQSIVAVLPSRAGGTFQTSVTPHTNIQSTLTKSLGERARQGLGTMQQVWGHSRPSNFKPCTAQGMGTAAELNIYLTV
jgi:hypothetical protein